MLASPSQRDRSRSQYNTAVRVPLPLQLRESEMFDLGAADLAPTLAHIQADGAITLKAIASALDAAGIATPRGQGKWSPTQVKRTLEALKDAEGLIVD
jgi:hypothetical protein